MAERISAGNRHRGSTLDDFLETEGVLPEFQARAIKEQSLATYRTLGDKWIVGLMSWSLSRAVIAQGDLPAAAALLAECAAIGEALGNEWTVPYVLEGFGDIALAEDNAPRAVSLYGAAAVVRERLGLTLSPSDRITHEQAFARMHAALPPEEFANAWESGRATPIDEALSLALGRSAA